jgi:SAM-dependent methyltransferase
VGPEAPAIWEYYDRRAAQGVRGVGHAVEYWNGLGVQVTAADVEAETAELALHLRALTPASFVEVGAGPGTFTALLPGRGIALDQSAANLQVLLAGPANVPAVRADALSLPIRDGGVERVFATHIYGLLTPEVRLALISEAERVARELVIVDAGRPAGVPAEHWQARTLPDGSEWRVFRRHFNGPDLAAEVGGVVVYAGRFYVMIRATASDRRVSAADDGAMSRRSLHQR